MGLLDAMQRGAERLHKNPSALVGDSAWRDARGRAGTVLDSRRTEVRWSVEDAAHAFVVAGTEVGVVRVPYAVDGTRAALGDAQVELRLGKRGLRRSTWGACADMGGVTYRLRQRGRRLAELDRGPDTIAVLARPRRAPRVVNWADSLVTAEEIALGHALAVYADIGAPGALANVFSHASVF